jgi:hypothetical protein
VLIEFIERLKAQLARQIASDTDALIRTSSRDLEAEALRGAIRARKEALRTIETVASQYVQDDDREGAHVN